MVYNVFCVLPSTLPDGGGRAGGVGGPLAVHHPLPGLHRPDRTRHQEEDVSRFKQRYVGKLDSNTSSHISDNIWCN